MKKKTFLYFLSLSLLASCVNNGSLSSNIENESTIIISSDIAFESELSSPSVSENNSTSEVKTDTWNDDKTLSILTIGNSFSDDAMEYVAKIAFSLGVENVDLGNLYIGGCNLQTHSNNLTFNSPNYEYRTNTGNGWTTAYSYKMKDALFSKNWDFISLQQSSGVSGVASSYEPYLSNILSWLTTNKPSSKIVWHMTWAYQQNSTHGDFGRYNKNQLYMYECIVDVVENSIMSNETFDLLIPSGTAIQNMRTSFIGDTLTRDGYHLSYDLGRYIAGLTVVKSLTKLEITDDVFSPVNAIYKAPAIEAVNNAILNPYEVSESTYLQKADIVISKYDLLDLELTPFGYYNATDASRPTSIITNASNSNQFFATKRFTQEELPVGSIIVLEPGWQYRPEVWKNESVHTSRPPITTMEYVLVDDSYWNGYTYRAFNIAKIGTPALTNLVNEATNALKIYVPKVN